MNKLLITLVLAFSFSTAFAKDTWEHKVESRGSLSTINPEYLAQQLTKSGQKGWELVDVKTEGRRSWFFYKRKK
jgi:hypothetical protein